MTTPVSILITGATGRIGRVVAPALATRYTIRAYNRSTTPVPGVHDIVIGDLTDLETLRRAARGMEAILHLAAAAGNRYPWEQILSANIIGVHNVFEAARLEGVRRVVFASTSQVINGYPPEARITWDMLPRPISEYAVSKAYGEMLGHLYAHQHGLEVVCLRIGTFWAEDRPPEGFQPQGKYLSHRDGIHLCERALVQPGLRFAIVFGTSNNPRCRFDLDHTRQVLGYEPLDAEE